MGLDAGWPVLTPDVSTAVDLFPHSLGLPPSLPPRTTQQSQAGSQQMSEPLKV